MFANVQITEESLWCMVGSAPSSQLHGPQCDPKLGFELGEINGLGKICTKRG